ncbi:MAG: type II toxin-antitoxin system VapC family toxin [Acidimicrobiales bacterium]
MTTVVLDASAAVDWLLRRPAAARLDADLAGLDWVAPELIDAEVASGLRRRERLGLTPTDLATLAIQTWLAAPLERFPLAPLLPTAWTLRHHVTAYDALYVALARVLACPVVTTDRRLSRAPNLGITVTAVT